MQQNRGDHLFSFHTFIFLVKTHNATQPLTSRSEIWVYYATVGATISTEHENSSQTKLTNRHSGAFTQTFCSRVGAH